MVSPVEVERNEGTLSVIVPPTPEVVNENPAEVVAAVLSVSAPVSVFRLVTAEVRHPVQVRWDADVPAPPSGESAVTPVRYAAPFVS